MICDPTWAVTKRPDLGCSCTLIQTNRTVDGANTLIFHLKTLRCTARWGVLPIKGMLERSTQHGGWPGHWDMPPGCFTYCMSTEGQYVICCMCYSLLLIPHSESQCKGKKITRKNWEPCMEHIATERGLTRKSVRHLLTNVKPEPKREMEKTKQEQQWAFLSSNSLAYNSQQRDLAVIKRAARYRSEIRWVYNYFQVAEYEIPAPFSPGVIHLPQVMERHSPSGWSCSCRP